MRFDGPRLTTATFDVTAQTASGDRSTNRQLSFAAAICAFIPLLITAAIVAACLLLVVAHVMERCDISRPAAILIAIALLTGSLVDLPTPFSLQATREFGARREGRLNFWLPFKKPKRWGALTAVRLNLGGCLIPLSLTLFFIGRLFLYGDGKQVGAIFVGCVCSITLCTLAVRDFHGAGLVIPAFWLSLAIALISRLLLPSISIPQHRPEISFISAVVGTLIGSDLFHVEKVANSRAAKVSIGGAGMFDGITVCAVLSAALS